MDNFKINFKVDGKNIDESEIKKMELSRYHHVFKIFEEKNIAIKLDDNQLNSTELASLPLEKAKLALAQTRESIGKEKTLELFKPEISRSDQMWENIAKEADASQPLQKAIVEVNTENISIFQFMMFNQLLMKTNNLYMPSMIHPEHYYFDAAKGGRQVIIETFGMFKDPSYLDLRPSDSKVNPIELDSDDDLVMRGDTLLADTGENTHIIGLHQLKKRPNGMQVKLGVFLPQSAPKEIIEGHKWHLMVEFNNGLHIAAQQHPNLLQRTAMELALKKMKPKN